MLNKHISRSAYLLIATGILHNLIGIGLGYSVLGDMLREGLFNSTHMQFDREAIFWFLFSGVAMMLWGMLMLKLEAIPLSFSWSLLLLSCVGAIIMPLSGFWLVMPQALYMLWQTQKQAVVTTSKSL